MTRRLLIPPHEIAISAIRAQGAGGQNVNKVSSAVHLRFDIRASSLPEPLKQRLLAWPDARITRDGVIVIKAQEHRSLALNRADAMARLQAVVEAAAHEPRHRRATAPTLASRRRRLEGKRLHSQIKSQRARPAGNGSD